MSHQDIAAELGKSGFAFVANQSKEDVSTLLGFLGEVIHTTDVKVKPESRALVTSARALDFHTDHHRAKWILWHCIEQTDIGGETILADAVKAYRQLDEDGQKALAEIMLFEHKLFEGDKDSYPLVSETNGKLRFYYSFWLVKKELPEAQKRALAEFRANVVKQPAIKVKLQKNDVIIVDNHRILHGRCEIKGAQNRFLKRFWVQ